MTRKEEIKLMIKKVVASHLSGEYKIFLFGSQAGLAELKRADIDVGVEAERPLTNSEEMLIWIDLEDLPTLYKFDLVDFKKVDLGFKKVALSNIEIL
jgi:predicted nucleotidyltransferase